MNAAAAGGKPRLYLMDYWALSAFWDQTAPDANMVQHAGRALFYLRRYRLEAGGRRCSCQLKGTWSGVDKGFGGSAALLRLTGRFPIQLKG